MSQEMRFDQPIREAGLEHEAELNRRLQKIQLMYADMLAKKPKPKDLPQPFADILSDHTYLFLQLKNAFRETKKDDVSQEGVESYLSGWKEKFNAIYEASAPDWPEKIIQETEAEVRRLTGEPKKPDTEKPQAGVLDYNQGELETLASYGLDESVLSTYQLTPKDACVFLHFPEAYKRSAGANDSALSSQKIKQSLSLLAEQIVDIMPETRAVVGISWLIESVGKRLGFHLMPEARVKENDMSTWYQFLNKEGQIDTARLEQLKKSGELPYQSRVGYIPVQEFLQKYLPEKRKAQPIVLKEIASGWKEKVKAEDERLRAEGERIMKEWGNITVAGLSAWLETFPQFAVLLDQAGNKQVLLDLLTRAKQESLDTWEEVKGKYDPELQTLGAQIKEIQNKGKYTESAVIIGKSR